MNSLRTLSALALILALPSAAVAQVKKVGIRRAKASFVVSALPDDICKLCLKRNKTYQYIHWNGWAAKESVLEEGTYSIESEKISFRATKKAHFNLK